MPEALETSERGLLKRRALHRWRRTISLAAVFLCANVASPVFGQTCTGDCDGDGMVTVNEIVTALNIGLGARPITDCPAADSGGDGSVTVDEIVAALNFALNGCPISEATATPTASATPTPPPGEVTRVDVGSGSGLPGAVVRIPVTLSQSGGVITAVSSDITYDKTHIRVVLNDGAPCAINPDIGPGTAPNKMLLSTVLQVDDSHEKIRAGAISFDTPMPIPDGVVFTCDFRIMPAAPAGEVVLENLPDASDAGGNVPPLTGSNGSVTIR